MDPNLIGANIALKNKDFEGYQRYQRNKKNFNLDELSNYHKLDESRYTEDMDNFKIIDDFDSASFLNEIQIELE